MGTVPRNRLYIAIINTFPIDANKLSILFTVVFIIIEHLPLASDSIFANEQNVQKNFEFTSENG